MLIKLDCVDLERPNSMVQYEFCTKTHQVMLNGVRQSFEECKKDPRLSYHEPVMAFASKDKTFRDANIQGYSLQPEITPYSQENPLIGKSRTISKLSIQLGLACNYQCKYCLQAQNRADAIKVPSREEIDAFLLKFREAGIHLDPNAMVDLWGGEPLVYWRALKSLVPQLRAMFGEKIRLSLFTNGVLLTDEITDFLIKYHVQVHISHDGPGFALRDKTNPLFDKETKEKWLNLHEKSRLAGVPMSFFAVLHQGNCDLFELRGYFDKYFSPHVHLDFGGAASETENLHEESIIDEEQANVLRWSMLRAVVTEPGKWPGLERRVFNLMGRLVHQIPPGGIRYHCNAVDESVLCVDIQGNILSCQNRSASTHKIGSLTEYEAIKNPFFTHWKLRPDCADCLVLGACKGGCPDISDQAMARCCVNDWAFHYGVFTVAWFLLTGTIIQRIDPLPKFLLRRQKVVPIHKENEKGE